MEDFAIDIMIGTGTGATSIRMDIPKFTLVGATTKLAKISGPLRDRFGNVLKLDFYEVSDLAEIVRRSFHILGITVKKSEICEIIAKKSRGTPRIVNRFVKTLRDYQIVGHDISDPIEAERIFTSLGIDSLGLDGLDRKILETLAFSFAGRTVGLHTLASIV